MSFTAALLDDQRMFREALADYLRAQEFQVTCSTADPAEFLAAVRAAPPQIAVIDLLLGAEDAADPGGLEVLEELRRWVPDVRTAILSGSFDPQMPERCHTLGASAYFDKGRLVMTQLPALLHEIAAGQRVFPMPQTLSATAPPENPSLAKLTLREKDVLRFVATGADNLKISAHLEIAERTVRAHLSSIYRKLEAQNRTELALLARRLGVRPPAEPAAPFRG